MTWLVLAIYVVCPFLLLRADRKWGAIGAILAIWLPIEFRLLQHFSVPPAAAIVAGMAAGVLAFRSRPDIIDVSAAFDLRKMDPRQAFLNFVLFAALGIPLGLAIGFLEPQLHLPDIRTVPTLLATIFLLNALPEEILFRGIIQHYTENTIHSRLSASILAALIFGAAHLNNGAVVPNYKYFAMATLAGLFYGRAWRRQRNVLTSSITHTLVNTGWRLFFR